MAFAMFAWMRSRIPQYPTLRKFYWFLAFSLIIVWAYSEAMLDRAFALITSFLMIWTNEGGIVDEPGEGQGGVTEEASENAEA